MTRLIEIQGAISDPAARAWCNAHPAEAREMAERLDREMPQLKHEDVANAMRVEITLTIRRAAGAA